MSFTVALIGRPNVGKSTLFNRLTGLRHALVDDRPGVTRDRREGAAHVGGLAFTVIDTAGLEDVFDDSLEARMRQQTERAIVAADLALLIIDARAGVTPLDEHFARWLRKGKTPVRIVANKCEGTAGRGGLMDAFSLGFGEPIALSAAHGEGLADLVEALLPFALAAEARAAADADAPAEDEDWDAAVPEITDDEEEAGSLANIAIDEAAEAAALARAEAAAARPIQLAIIGRPNVGKSTLVNALLGEERMLTGPEAGITRDAISVPWVWRGRPFKLIDTAGMRRKTRIEDKLEQMAVQDTLRAIRYANVVVLVVDQAELMERQDLALARLVEQEGRALVIAVNKWDAVENASAVLQRLKDRLQTSLPQAKGLPTVVTSGRTRHNLDKLMAQVIEVYGVWNRRVRTKELNRWLAAMVDQHPPPLVQGRRLKLRFMTQARIRPPRFVLWSSRPEALPEDYRRYLVNGLREAFDLPGVPIRLELRRTKNPFAN